MNTLSLISSFLLFTLTSFSVSASNDDYEGTAYAIKGAADVKQQTLFNCDNGRSRPSPIGIKSIGNKHFTVPADVNYSKEHFAVNLYEKCSNIKHKGLSEVDISSVPVIEVDKNGEVITGYIFADNYFELFINGKLIGVDPVPFTPFNSNIVRFKVTKPYDIAIKVVDWEENAGLGSESNRGSRYHAGDGGLIASFSDGTKTSADWSAQTFYTSPIYDLSCVTEKGSQRLSASCDTGGFKSIDETYSLHWDIQANWASNNSHKSWPKAVEYTEDEIGVNNKKAYMNFQQQFTGAGASFIWSSNLVLDNLVLLRYTVQ